jgi:hypothetical protein
MFEGSRFHIHLRFCQAGGFLMNNFGRTLILTCILAGSGVAQSTAEAERDLQAAINKEVVQGDLNSAIGLYRNILSRYGSQRQIAAQALAGMVKAATWRQPAAARCDSHDCRHSKLRTGDC